MDQSTKENSKIITFMEMEHILGQMEELIKVMNLTITLVNISLL